MTRSNKYLSLTIIFSTAIAITGCIATPNNQNGPSNPNRSSSNYPNTGYNNNQNPNPNYNQNQGDNNGAQPIPGQTPAALNDFVGAKAGQAEGDLVRRGYVLRKTVGLYSFWEETATGGCVSIVTNDGRYQSLVYTTPQACR